MKALLRAAHGHAMTRNSSLNEPSNSLTPKNSVIELPKMTIIESLVHSVRKYGDHALQTFETWEMPGDAGPTAVWVM